MALNRSDHKKIAMTIAQELQRVLGDANGQRVLGRHQARLQPATMHNPVSAEPDDMNAMMEEMSAHEQGEPPQVETEEDAATGPKSPVPPKKGSGFPFHKGPPSKGGGMKHGRR